MCLASYTIVDPVINIMKLLLFKSRFLKLQPAYVMHIHLSSPEDAIECCINDAQ